MKINIIIFLVLLSGVCFAQEVSLIGFEPSECDRSTDIERLRNRIISQHFMDDTLKLELGVIASCCISSYAPTISFTLDTLRIDFTELTYDPDNLKAPPPPTYRCYCCFQLTYFILGLKGKVFNVKYRGLPLKQSDEKYLTFPIKYHIYEGDTTGYYDKYGLFQGFSYSKTLDGGYIERYIEDNHTLLSLRFDKLGNLVYQRNHKKNGDLVRFIKYDIRGNIIKEETSLKK